MRVSLFVLGIFMAVCAERPAKAQSYPWCAYYTKEGDATNCGFVTFEQCLATLRRSGGSCGAKGARSRVGVGS
jgi:hypothetical protein